MQPHLTFNAPVAQEEPKLIPQPQGMKYQVCRPLTPIEFAALKADIADHGVLIPIDVDENGAILDGHHRVQAWQELRAEGIDIPQYARLIRKGLSEEQKRNHARKLNLLRRQMTKDEREQLMVDMRQDGESYRKIAEVVGVSAPTVMSTVKNLTVEQPRQIVGKDGKRRDAKKSRKPKTKTLFDPGNSAAIDATAIKKDKADRRAANLATYRQNGHAPFEPVHGDVTIHNVDARYLADHCKNVHLAIMSPPYNVGIEYDVYPDNLIDYWQTLIEPIFRQCIDVMVEGARICVVAPFGVGRKPWVPLATGMLETLDHVGFVARGQIIWDKGTSGNSTAWGSYRMPSAPSLRDTCECIVVAQKGKGGLEIPRELIQHDDAGSYTPWLKDGDYFMELAQDHWQVAPESAQRVGHPAPFPTELVRRLIHFYGFPGCHVLDPFGGSGTVGVVAKELGCQATLFEISPDYCRMAEERIYA
jgi:site-specific DNA-methyltransferase (adenine-specific)